MDKIKNFPFFIIPPSFLIRIYCTKKISLWLPFIRYPEVSFTWHNWQICTAPGFVVFFFFFFFFFLVITPFSIDKISELSSFMVRRNDGLFCQGHLIPQKS